MARIVDAGKKEVLHNLEIEEYGNVLEVETSSDGSSSLSVRIEDPRTAERAAIRKAVKALTYEEMGPEEVVDAVLTHLDNRDTESLAKYGRDKDKPSPFVVHLWLDPKVAKALSDALVGAEVSGTVASTIREALQEGAGVNTKGF